MTFRCSFGCAMVAIAAACSSEPATTKFEPECTLNQFRACETDACRGSQKCIEPGVWSACDCVVLDAAFPEAGPDAHDSGSDAAEAAAEAASDAPLDALGDGPSDSAPDAAD